MTAALPDHPTTPAFGPETAAALGGLVSGATTIRRDEPLAKRTTLRVGGPASFFVEPASEADLAAMVRFCAERDVPWFVLGRGSNLLVRDGGFRGVVVSLAHPVFSRIEVIGEQVHCGAGAKLKAIVAEARRHGLGGLEFLEGIPGSLGGALRMNAGAMGGATFEVVDVVRVMDLTGRIQERSVRELAPAYRGCAALRNQIALGAVLRGQASLREVIERRLQEFSQRRWKSQPAAPSAGCIFKNPPSVPAGKLIDELGLKGARVGGAYVSAEHGNFIVNDGTARAGDVLELIELIRRRVREQRGIELETEVEIVGE
jgi:UDP-N-acetylenolpyruvoylglucosamine reductase